MIFILSLLLQFSAWSSVNLSLQFKTTEVTQGSIVPAKIVLDPTSTQVIPSLEGQTIGSDLYFYSVSPLMRKEGDQTLEADGKVIFLNVPKSNTLSGKVLNDEIEVKWNEIKILPTEATEKLIFGNFDIPLKFAWMKWVLIILGVLVLSGVGYFFWIKIQKKNRIKSEKKKLKEEVIGAKNFQELIILWKNKYTYLDMFPHLKSPFEKFETTLFKYQFKPTQTEAEQAEAMTSYKEFVNQVQGGFNGI